MSETNFLPTDYSQPNSNDFYKFKDGANTFRILTAAITGFQYFNTAEKFVRSRTEFETEPTDIKPDSAGKPGKVQHFWAFLVLNLDEKKPVVQLATITQKGIQKDLLALIQNPKWGNPTKYDITITRSGSGLKTEYNVMPSPASEIAIPDLSKYNVEKMVFGSGSSLDEVANEFANVPGDGKAF